MNLGREDYWPAEEIVYEADWLRVDFGWTPKIRLILMRGEAWPQKEWDW